MSYDTRRTSRDQQYSGRAQVLTSIEADWRIVKNTSPFIKDASLTAVSTLVRDLSSSTSRMNRVSYGTSLIIRQAYNAGDTSLVADTQVRVLGVDPEGKYHWLVNGVGNITDTILTGYTTDLTTGTTKYTNVLKNQVYDLQGSALFGIFISTSYAATNATSTNVYLEAKIV